MKKRVAIRLDAGPAIGSGHLIRCLTIADELFQEYGVEVVFICRNQISIQIKYPIIYLKNEYNMQCKTYSYPTLDDEIMELVSVLKNKKIEVLIVDHYGAGDNYFKKIRNHIKYLFALNDGLECNVPVDGIINGNLYGIFANYKKIPMQLLGGQFTLLRKEFCQKFEHKINKKMENIYITSGGADPTKFCFKMIQSMYLWNKDINYHVIVGSDFDDEYVLKFKDYDVIIHKNANMKDCMLQADLFVTSAGSTLYELIATHTPSISFCISKDQEVLANTVWNMGLSAEGGEFSLFDERKFRFLLNEYSEYMTRQNQSVRMNNIISVNGANRVATRIYNRVFGNDNSLCLRTAKKTDCDLLFRWANDETNRNNSFSKEKIKYVDHRKWFNNKLKDARCHIYILEQNGVEIGQVRLDGVEEAEIDYFISPAFRGQGLAKRMLLLVEKKVKNSNFGIKMLVAHVLNYNIPSRKVFHKLGYQEKITALYVEYTKKL